MLPLPQCRLRPAQFYRVGPCGTYAEYEGKFFMQERGFICQSCHMPEIDRPVATNSPIRRGRQHLWRGGHDPDMVKRAVAIQVKADTTSPKPGERVTFTLTLVNAGAGHKIPTGDPDRFSRSSSWWKMHRDGSWRSRSRPWDAGSCGSRPFWSCMITAFCRWPAGNTSLSYRLPDKAEGLKVKTRVQYHIVTDTQHEMLQQKYGLTGHDPYRFLVYEREFPLSEQLETALAASDQFPTANVAPRELSRGSAEPVSDRAEGDP